MFGLLQRHKTCFKFLSTPVIRRVTFAYVFLILQVKLQLFTHADVAINKLTGVVTVHVAEYKVNVAKTALTQSINIQQDGTTSARCHQQKAHRL